MDLGLSRSFPIPANGPGVDDRSLSICLGGMSTKYFWGNTEQFSFPSINTMKVLSVTEAALTAFGAAYPVNAATNAPATATLKSGVVVGTQKTSPGVETAVNEFLGIPYAAPPLDVLRFALPSPPAPWLTPRNVTTWPQACIQQGNTDVLLASESEDCLYVNVFAPASPVPENGRTVMAWIHGGGFKSGSASMTHHDGTRFAAHQDIVVVTLNYRLGPFGFPVSSAVPAKEQNVRLYDQRFALQWVQENIASFGGDPSRVTIFGESSGATSVSRLVGTMNNTSTRSASRFSRAGCTRGRG